MLQILRSYIAVIERLRGTRLQNDTYVGQVSTWISQNEWQFFQHLLSKIFILMFYNCLAFQNYDVYAIKVL